MDKLQELKASVAEKEGKLKEIQAQHGEEAKCEHCEKMDKMMSYAMDYVRSIQNYAYEVENSMYKMHSEHQVGHIPKIQGAGAMEKALKALGIDKDWEIIKPVIFASKNNSIVAEISYKPESK